MWGCSRESGLWRSGAKRWRWRILWRDHDSLFVAAGRWRLRIMKPGRSL